MRHPSGTDPEPSYFQIEILSPKVCATCARTVFAVDKNGNCAGHKDLTPAQPGPYGVTTPAPTEETTP